MEDARAESWSELAARIAASITTDQANTVRALRVDEALTWRGVSEAFYTQFPNALYGPDLVGNQAIGDYLCRAAAHRLGEDPDSAPWN